MKHIYVSTKVTTPEGTTFIVDVPDWAFETLIRGMKWIAPAQYQML